MRTPPRSGMPPRRLVAALALCAVLAGCASKPKVRPLSSLMVSALAEPAVFKVVELAEYQLHDVRFVPNTLTLPAIASSPDCWYKIADAPSQYLNITLRSDRLLAIRKVFASGSSVAVGWNGIFLTNAHVITPPDERRLGELAPSTLGVAASLVSALQARPMTMLQQVLHPAGPAGCSSAPQNQDVRRYAETKLAVWMIERGMLVSARLHAVYVVTRPRESKWPMPRLDFGALGLKPLSGSLADALLHPPLHFNPLTALPDPTELAVDLPGSSDTPESYATEAEVLAPGEPFPGEDVAVLRSKRRLNLICLPLGDSDRAQLPDGSEIAAFGFPGAAEMPGLSKDVAHPRVIRHDGKVAQRVMTEKNWEALYTNAAVSEGDSGGPILDPFGRVVGLNVYGNTSRSGNNVSVPINLAKRYLDKAQVRADPGSLTGHWAKGQDYYAREDYAKALVEFEIVNGTRADPDAPGSKAMDSVKSSWILDPARLPLGSGNDYVEQAIANCKQFLQKR